MHTEQIYQITFSFKNSCCRTIERWQWYELCWSEGICVTQQWRNATKLENKPNIKPFYVSGRQSCGDTLGSECHPFYRRSSGPFPPVCTAGFPPAQRWRVGHLRMVRTHQLCLGAKWKLGKGFSVGKKDWALLSFSLARTSWKLS